MNYSVLVKTVVNVRIDNVEAESQVAAIEKITSEPFYARYFDNIVPIRDERITTKPLCVRYIEWAEEDYCYLVDEQGDEEFENSRWYDADDPATPWDPTLPKGVTR